MAKFSERIGITKPKEIQLNSMDGDLKNSLWNYMSETFEYGDWKDILNIYIINHFKSLFPDILVIYDSEYKKELLKYYKKNSWNEVYDFVEFTIQNFNLFKDFVSIPKNRFEKGLNSILERELSGYRSINSQIVPITNNNEIETINNAIVAADEYGFNGIREHIVTALTMIGEKPTPDYRNSIKESISAVEGICKLLTGENSGGIDDALKKLEKKINLHSALKAGLSKIYGYTSDKGGIRHPILEETDIDLADAKFMLVSCSAFVNYLIEKAIKYDLIPNRTSN